MANKICFVSLGNAAALSVQLYTQPSVTVILIMCEMPGTVGKTVMAILALLCIHFRSWFYMPLWSDGLNLTLGRETMSLFIWNSHNLCQMTQQLQTELTCLDRTQSAFYMRPQRDAIFFTALYAAVTVYDSMENSLCLAQFAPYHLQLNKMR